MIDNEKRNSPSNCILPLLPYLTESPILLGSQTSQTSQTSQISQISQISQTSQSSQSSDRLVFDSFHSTALEFVTPSQFSAAESDGLWDKHPTEPELGSDATPGISDEVVNYLEKQKMDDSIWMDVINGYAEAPNRTNGTSFWL